MLKVMIYTTGAAYSENEQITHEGRIELKENLKKIGNEILEGFNYGYVMDINGNKTGTWNLDKEENEDWQTTDIIDVARQHLRKEGYKTKIVEYWDYKI